jgi:hypothetical protein
VIADAGVAWPFDPVGVVPGWADDAGVGAVPPGLVRGERPGLRPGGGGGEYVITDEAGTPVHPEWYSDEFGRLLKRAGLRRITLHDSRHTTLTLMEHAGVPISVISKWAGQGHRPAHPSICSVEIYRRSHDQQVRC